MCRPMSGGTSNRDFSIHDLDANFLQNVITAVVEMTGGGVEVLSSSLEPVVAAGRQKV